MDPYGHHHNPNHGRHRSEEEEEEDFRQGRSHQPPPSYGNEPPPSFYGGDEPPPPFYGGDEPPPRHHQSSEVYHTSHGGGPDSDRPPPPSNYNDYDPPPFDAADNRHQHHPHMPHFPSSDHHQNVHGDGGGMSGKPSVKVYSKAETNFALTIRDGKVILTPSDPSDPCQHWIKEEKYSTKVKDEEGYPSFALINKATGQAMKHAIGATHPELGLRNDTPKDSILRSLDYEMIPVRIASLGAWIAVQLTPYKSDTVDESILWTESKNLGDGYRTIRMVNNIKLNVDALHGDANHGGVHDGTNIVLWEWKKGDNQRWNIAPY